MDRTLRLHDYLQNDVSLFSQNLKHKSSVACNTHQNDPNRNLLRRLVRSHFELKALDTTGYLQGQQISQSKQKSAFLGGQLKSQQKSAFLNEGQQN